MDVRNVQRDSLTVSFNLLLFAALPEILRAVRQPIRRRLYSGGFFLREFLSPLFEILQVAGGRVEKGDLLAWHEQHLADRQAVLERQAFAGLQDVTELGFVCVPIG